MKALHNLVIIEKDPAPEKIGSIYISNLVEGEHSPPFTGTILSVGPKVTDPDIVPGASVAFGDLTGTLFEYDNKSLIILHVDKIGAIL